MEEKNAIKSRFIPDTARRRIISTLKIAVFLGILYFIFNDVNLGEIWATLKRVPASAFALAIAIQGSVLLAQAFRWKLLLADLQVSFKEVFAFTLLGFALTMVAPSIIIADGIKAFFLGKRNQVLLHAMSSMVLARLMGFGVLILFLLLTLPSHFFLLDAILGSLFIQWWQASLIGAGALVALMAFGFSKKVRKVMLDIKNTQASAPRLLLAFASSAYVQFGSLLVAYVGIAAMGLPITISDLMFLMPFVGFLLLIPVSIGQMGVKDGLAVFFYTLLPGVSKEGVLALAAFGYCIQFILSVLTLGAAYVLLRPPRP